VNDGVGNAPADLPCHYSPNSDFQGILGSFADLNRRKRSRKHRSKIDSYATESDSEFFAVASEYFFEKPRVLTSEYPEVYRQDTAARLVGGKGKRGRPGS
jgi:Mlc titration factor MtfA (ptsG expression regulator)